MLKKRKSGEGVRDRPDQSRKKRRNLPDFEKEALSLERGGRIASPTAQRKGLEKQKLNLCNRRKKNKRIFEQSRRASFPEKEVKVS